MTMGITKTMQLEEMEREHEAQRLADAELELQLPRPAGYRVLVALPQPEDKFEGTNILKTEKAKQQDHIMSIIGLVVDMGSGAYADKERFPDGPWCKEGDFVMFRMNSGTRFTIAGIEYRLMNDDSIEAVVDDPTGIQRA
jgi:co-chaperonin GroES (HSP10)|tara:strand:+ start:66 stop:485 length:420 start_codon:yes stop_codon:yes gene_type:complete